MHRLIEEVMSLSGPVPEGGRHDGALLSNPGGRLAFTTDSYVIDPLFFPGGDIGSLSVYGTVNDLAMCGATPLWLSAGMILEEGFPVRDLERIVRSMGMAADRAGVQIVTGDTKVVERGKGDGIFICTAGIGAVREGLDIGPSRVRPGDAVVLSGDIGRHGMAIICSRDDLGLDTSLESDLAPLADAVRRVLDRGCRVRCMRDLTRGGLASALNEISGDSSLGIRIDEEAIPVVPEVRAACELLGFDPLHVANEGRFVLFVDPEDAGTAVEALSGALPGVRPAVIGSVARDRADGVVLRSLTGCDRLVDMLSGEQLPRIC